MTAPLVVLAFLVAAWALTVAWAHRRRKREEREAWARLNLRLVDFTAALGGIGPAMEAAGRSIAAFGEAFYNFANDEDREAFRILDES